MSQEILTALAVGAGAFLSLAVSFVVGVFVGRGIGPSRPRPAPSMMPDEMQMMQLEEIAHRRMNDAMAQMRAGNNGGPPGAASNGFTNGGM